MSFWRHKKTPKVVICHQKNDDGTHTSHVLSLDAGLIPSQKNLDSLRVSMSYLPTSGAEPPFFHRDSVTLSWHHFVDDEKAKRQIEEGVISCLKDYYGWRHGVQVIRTDEAGFKETLRAYPSIYWEPQLKE